MALVHRIKRHGGGIIKWKLFMSMFLLCGVALLNLSGASAVALDSNSSSVANTTNVNPHVTTVDPSNNAVNVPVNKVINVTFNESIKNGTNWIELQNNNGTLIPINKSISGNTLTITPNSNLSNGTKYSLLIHTGSVTDLAGNKVAGYVTRFTTADTVAPVVVSSDPSNNVKDVVLGKVIKVTFSEPIKAGSSWIVLQDSKGTVIPITTSINGKVLTITPGKALSEETKYSLLIHTGSVTDLAGNKVAGYVTRFTTADTVAPVVVSSDPSNNVKDVVLGKVIKVTFSEPIKAGSSWIVLQDSKGTVIPITTSINGKVLTITPGKALSEETKYSLLIHTGSVTDLAGNKVAGYVTRFTTADTVAPVVVSSDPSNNVKDVVLGKVIKVTFSEPIKAGSSWIVLQDSKGTVIPITTSINGKVLTITPGKALSEETKYSLLIHTGSVTDLAGNKVAGYVTRFTTDTPAVTFTSAQILDAAARVKAYVDANHGLPGYVTIGSTNVSMAQFLQMMSVDVLQINNGSNAPIVLPNVKAPTNPSDNVGTGNIYTTEYLSLAQQLKNIAGVTAPNYISSSQGNIQFDSAVYMYSRILNYYKNNNALPNYAAISPWTTITHPNTFNQAAFNQIMSTASRFWYQSGISTAAGIEAYHCGDCWAMSAYLYNKLTAAGIHSKIIQYGTEYASNHRSVQYYKDGCWYDVPYRAWGFNSMFRNTQSSGYLIAQS